MRDSSRTTNRGRSRPLSRRDALRYAAGSALAGLSATSVSLGTPPLLPPPPVDRLRYAPDTGGAHSRCRLFRGDQLRVGIAPRLLFLEPSRSPGPTPSHLPLPAWSSSATTSTASRAERHRRTSRGFAGGVADARTAWQLHTAAGGGQSAPIFFSVDDDISRNTWNAVALQWFRGINSVLGVQRTGVYGASTCANGPPPMASSEVRVHPAAGGPGRPVPGRAVR